MYVGARFLCSATLNAINNIGVTMVPIFTIIRNKRDTSRTIYWAGKESKWLPAKSDLIVPFEIWTLAEDYQKEAIKAELKNDNVELIVCIASKNGETVQVPFEPFQNLNKAADATQVVETKKIDTTKEQVAELDHTVKIVNNETSGILQSMGAKPIGFEDEIVPAREVKNGEPEPVKEATVEEPIEAKEPVAEQPAKKTRSKKS
jgi:hypothetical protein